ncbi:MAG: HIT family protein [Planctomycetota bacterium]
MDREKLWAPWRIHYVGTCNEESECFLCRDLNNPEDDDKNLVLWRTDKSIVVLNHYPYNNGHLLIAPSRHIPSFDHATDQEMLELNKLIRESQKALSLAIKPHGFNIGMNFGRCAGAGLPEHMHIHVVPRWNGDTNYINVCSKTDVISQSLTELLEVLKKVSAENNLPQL